MKIRIFRVLLAAIVVVVAAWYSPLITAAAWHIFHLRGWYEYRGLHVQVPWPWIADGEPRGDESMVAPEGLSMKKMPFTIDRRLSNQSLFVTVISQDGELTAEQQTTAWLQMFRAAHPGAVFGARTPLPVPAGASCESAESHWNQRGVVWTCISVGGGWVADFEGQTADVPAFFRIISNLKH